MDGRGQGKPSFIAIPEASATEWAALPSRLQNAKAAQELFEFLPVLSQIDGFHRGAQDGHSAWAKCRPG